MVALPLAINWVTALALAFLDGRRRWPAWIGLAGLAASSAVSAWLAAEAFQGRPQSVVTGGWPQGIGITLRADLLGASFATMSNGLLLVALLYEAIGGIRQRAFPALVVFLAAGMTGLYLTGDAFNYYVFFEVAMMSAFLLATYGEGPREIRDALQFTLVNLLGSALFLTAIVALYHVTGTLDMRGIVTWLGTVEDSTLSLVAALVLMAFGVKLGLFPFHLWLPPVYRGAQPAVAAILAGVLANIGSYGLLRFGAGIFRSDLQMASGLLLALGGASVLYGAVLALSRRTEGEVLAYSSISQAGYILMALAAGGAVGFAAATLFALVNALNKTLLFLASGLRGRWVEAAFVIGAFSVAGVPPAAGFVSKAALFRVAANPTDPVLIGLLLAGSALAFGYMFQVYQRRYWARPSSETPSAPQARVLVAVLAAGVLALGLWPEPLLAISEQVGHSLAGAP